MKIPFIKCHGSGNDFILVDEIENDFSFTEKEREELSLLLCDREEGIGSDGILFVMPSEKAEGRMRMFNSDGTEAEMCGNGLRCVARHMIEKLGKSEIAIETEKAVLPVSQVDEIFPDIDTFSVMIEPVSFDPVSLPMNVDSEKAVDVEIPPLTEKRTFTALSVPNPHIVSIVDTVDQDELSAVGRKANDLPEVFPNGVNVSYVQILERNKIFVRTYERGVGLTNACGTAMSASSLVSTILGPNDLDTPIVVVNKGGLVNCVVEKEEGRFSIQLRGNGTNVYQAVVNVDLKARIYTVSEQTFFEEENKTYEKLEAFAASEIGG
ncbi:diaminopimelate epimerase [Halobacillus karajensis]|uniref:Diaminopimelate epimerase n=1 Tax=Halobacillus karajensis TaxID=195088 RepID=A0A024P973_9BACI|nr:diaminopimelate epimerase [Halobacillus karajensis]CDQ20101.1 Diaminopimelate epimerase [Halobacillus karajensis]CDQ25236.1 Diaminopimelate epimerase [Halobacillus karajensis]CDQ28403.1 Diaminopimelate epimerase [Halobacillus karajensis]